MFHKHDKLKRLVKLFSIQKHFKLSQEVKNAPLHWRSCEGGGRGSCLGVPNGNYESWVIVI